jgi:hypothetical protein
MDSVAVTRTIERPTPLVRSIAMRSRVLFLSAFFSLVAAATAEPPASGLSMCRLTPKARH